ncbi:hypothetical protein BDZ94DRAFT_1254408 [Collybia nuda]|uniref:Uncharacterized protein n=1 Tax=Collybia nuda TaxID=64659 RepID=A0A9P6CGK7_9AGAR|nr:hypothetical protein BDZ94DRAFT_1254408 [Collybia nuda]
MSASTKPLVFYIAKITPNRHQVSVLLEELKAAYSGGSVGYGWAFFFHLYHVLILPFFLPVLK